MARRFVAAAGLAAVMLSAGCASAASAGSARSTPEHYLVDGCVVRFPSAVPEILTTGGHVCSPRVTGVSVATNGDLVVHTDPDAVTGIVSATVEEDETLSARGIQAGPSVGFDKTVVRFYSSRSGGVVRADGTEVRGTSSNVFLTWVSVPAQPTC